MYVLAKDNIVFKDALRGMERKLSLVPSQEAKFAACALMESSEFSSFDNKTLTMVSNKIL